MEKNKIHNFIGKKYSKEEFEVWLQSMKNFPHFIKLENILYLNQNGYILQGAFFKDLFNDQLYVLSHYGISSFNIEKGFIYFSLNDVDEINKFISIQQTIGTQFNKLLVLNLNLTCLKNINYHS